VVVIVIEGLEGLTGGTLDQIHDMFADIEQIPNLPVGAPHDHDLPIDVGAGFHEYVNRELFAHSLQLSAEILENLTVLRVHLEVQLHDKPVADLCPGGRYRRKVGARDGQRVRRRVTHEVSGRPLDSDLSGRLIGDRVQQ